MAAAEGFLTSVYALDDVTRPTFFELVAQAQLMSALRPAVRFVVSIYAERAPARLLPLFARWQAVYSLLVLLLEGYHLRCHGALFTERFFGLKRQEAAPRRKLSMLEGVALERRRQENPTLTARQQLASLVTAVLLPLLGQRCEERFREADRIPLAARTFRERCWASLYPWIHASGGLLALAYQMLYLLRRTDVWSPSLHICGLRVIRVLPDPPGLEPITKPGLLPKLWDLMGNMGSLSLWGVMYLFQFLQWWYQREHLLQPYKPKRVPPPPPARPLFRAKPLPALQGAGNGATGPRLVLLPQDPTVCPLCHRPRKNPAVSAGGFAFCYTCLVPHVQNHGRCPVSGLAMTVEQVRRIHDESND